MEAEGLTITIGSLIAIISIAISVSSYFTAKKRDIQFKATDYAVLKERVKTLEGSNEELKCELKEHKRDSKLEFRRLEEQLVKKVDQLNEKVDKVLEVVINKTR